MARIAADAAAAAVAAAVGVAAKGEEEEAAIKKQNPVQLLVLAFGDRPLEDSERAWLKGEVKAAFRESLGPPGRGEPAVLLYEERLDEEVVETLEKKRGPAKGSGWRGFYDLAAVDAKLPHEEVLDAARFLAHRSREKVIVPLFIEAHGGQVSRTREGVAGGPREPEVDFWEGEAAKFDDVASDLRVTLQRRWGMAGSRGGSGRGSA